MIRLLLLVVILCSISSSAFAQGKAATTRPTYATQLLDEDNLSDVYDLIASYEKLAIGKRVELMKELVGQFSAKQEQELHNLTDNFILPRANLMKFQGHGMIIEHDIFIRGGKAAWAVQRMLNVRLPAIEEKTPPATIKDIAAQAMNAINAYERGYESAVEDQKRQLPVQ